MARHSAAASTSPQLGCAPAVAMCSTQRATTASAIARIWSGKNSRLTVVIMCVLERTESTEVTVLTQRNPNAATSALPPACAETRLITKGNHEGTKARRHEENAFLY